MKCRVLAAAPVTVAAVMVGYWLAGGAGFMRGTAVLVSLRNGGAFHGTVVVDSPLSVVLDHPGIGRLWWLAWEVAEVTVLAGEPSWVR